MRMSHGDIAADCSTDCGAGSRALPGTARRRMAVGVAAHVLYDAALASDLDMTLPGLQRQMADAAVGSALFVLLDACHTLLDC